MDSNVKVVSSTIQTKRCYNPSGGDSESRTRFDYRIELEKEIADHIRRHTNVCRDYMIYPGGNRYYLNDKNIVKYAFTLETENSDRFDKAFVDAVERISNQGDAKHFIEHMLTDMKYRFRPPADIHQQMHEEFGMYDLSSGKISECFESRLEWNVAHFFIHLNSLLFDPGYDGPKRDRKSRVIICGGRHFDDYDKLEATMSEVMTEIAPWRDVVEIVSGHCDGADQLGEKYAEKHGLPCKVFPAQWEKYGRSAGPIRNSEMVKYAAEAEMPVVVAFRSPRTKGTNDTVKKATKKGFKVFVVDCD